MTQRPDPHETARDMGPLFETPQKHLSGRTDPQTSRDAAAAILPSIGRHQRWVLDLVRVYPGRTCPELAAQAGYDMAADEHIDIETCRQRIGRRLNELEKAGLIFRNGVRDGCCCWWPTNNEKAAAPDAAAKGGHDERG